MKKKEEEMAEGRTDREISETCGDKAQHIASMTEPIPPERAPNKWDKDVDVVIVGGGGSGLCAAAKALDNGATVLILEKQATAGGHSQNAVAAASFNTKAAKRKGLKTDKAKAFKHAYAMQSNATIDPRLLATLIDRSHEVYDWSETQSWGKRWDAITLDFIPNQGVARMIVKGALKDAPFTPATKFTAQMYPWVQWLQTHVTEKGGEILVNTKALALVKEEEGVIGVKAETAGGKIVYAKANRAVILAGGSFTNNREMIKKYCPDVYKKAVGTFLPPYDTGEVTRMALGAGADLAGINSWVAFSGGIPFFDTNYTSKSEPGPWFQYLRQGWLQLARGSGWLEVNAACEEYLPDTARADYEMHPKATAAQPGAASYVLFDADYPTTIWQTLPPPLLDDRPMTPDDPEDPWFEKFRHFAPKNWLDAVKQAIDLGGIKFSDTVEGLAKELGLDPVKLVDAVKVWNTKAAAGKPDNFGRLPQNMKPIIKPPFYGIKTGAILGGILCGARVNYKFQVLDKKRKPIPGLYAAGFTAGGINGEGIFNPTALSGVGFAFCSGWVAGDSATGDKSSYVPSGMEFESAIGAQRLLNKLNKHFPRLGAFVLKVGSSLSRFK